MRDPPERARGDDRPGRSLSARLVVVEGPDGAGKTTLAREIQRLHGHAIRHEGPPPPGGDALDYYFGRLWDAHVATFQSGQVLDRFALGERVYGPIIRGADRLGADGWDRVRRALDSIGALRVLCLPSYDVCRASWHARCQLRGEMIHDEYLFHQTYVAWCLMSDHPGQLLYDWTNPLSVRRVLARVAAHEERAA